jgi:hypothetical protein
LSYKKRNTINIYKYRNQPKLEQNKCVLKY